MARTISPVLSEADGERVSAAVALAESRSAGEIVTIEADIYAHFGSAEAVHHALRQIVASKKAAGS